MNSDLRNKVLWSLLFGLLIYMLLVLYGDWQALAARLAGFPWLWLPAILGLTLVNYLGRFLKWQWYLRLIGVPIDWRDSARIFSVAMLMVMTPGKLGEFLKSYMVKNCTGTPMAITAPVVLAERLTDDLAMLILAGLGLFAFSDHATRLLAGVVMLSTLALILLIQVRPLALWTIRFSQKVPLVRRFASGLHEFYESSYRLLRPRNLLIAVGIGIASWLCEGLAYFLVLVGIGVAPNGESLFAAVFIFSISTVIGAVVATPGGLGGTEGSLVALSGQLLGLARTPATASALLVRFATLWFGVSIGVVSLLLWPGLLSGADREQRPGTLADKQGVRP